jgi:branched-chain amino acid transport system substrate-binding protein
MRRVLAGIVIVAVIVVFLSIRLNAFRDYQIAEIATYTTSIAGLTVLTGLSGQISLGHGAFMAIGGYATALLLLHLSWPFYVVLLVSAAITAVAGAVVGVAAARLSGPYLAGATLMLGVALPSIADAYPGMFGGDQGLNVAFTAPGFLGVNFPQTRWQAWVATATALVTLTLLASLSRGRIGRNWRAVRDDEVAAAVAGIDVARARVLAFVVSAACAGLAGSLLAVITALVAPGAFPITLSITLLTAAVIGGLGTLPGAVWGALVIVLVQPYITNVANSHGLSPTTSANIPIAAYGLILILIMLAFPQGLQGAVGRLLGLASSADRARGSGGGIPQLRKKASVNAHRPPRTRTAGRRALAVVALATAALTAAACSSSSSSSPGSASSSGAGNAPLTASAPGITATTITVGSHQPLTGPAAPGYSEIAPASNAYFQYVNAHGGVYGRKIVYKYLDDAYNPTQTASVVRQLVLQDNVYALFDGLGTPTHLAVVNFLNSEKIPDVFVASGCDCWNEPSTEPYTFGWQLDYIREGKILGQYVAQHFKGKKIGYFYQNDEFGQDGVKGLDDEIPKSMVVARESYVTTNVNVAPQVAALRASGAQVVVSFSIPAFTALLKLTSLKVSYAPQLVVSNVGADPITLSGLVESFAKQGGTTVNGDQLINGIISDGYLPSVGDTGNSWITLFKQVHDTYDAKAPFDGNVLYGEAVAYTFVQAMLKAGRNPTRASLVSAIEGGLPQGPAVAPYDYSSTSHFGITGAYIGTITNGVLTAEGSALTTDTTATGAITSYTGTAQQAPSSGVPSP